MPTLTQLSSNLTEIVIYAAIALVTLTGLCKCIYPLLRNASLLNRAVIKLEKSTAAGERPIWREARFLGRSLRNEWQQFLLNAGQLDMRGIPCDTREYINEETVVEKPGHAQLAELIPGLLTSLGILGTFIGLMQGLTSVDFSNAEGTIQSIPSCSAACASPSPPQWRVFPALFCSTCSTACPRVARCARWTIFEDAFYELAMPRPLQPDVQMMCQKQDEEVRMAHLAENVGNHVAASLEMAIGRAMAPLTQSLDTFIKCATREQVDGVRRIVGQFVQQMNTSLSGQMTALGDTMSAVNQGQLQTQRNLQTTLDAARAMAGDAQAIREASSEIARQMQAFVQEMQNERSSRAEALAAQKARARHLPTGWMPWRNPCAACRWRRTC